MSPGNYYLKVDGSSGSRDLEFSLAEVMSDYFELWKVKQLKYGPHNIAEMGRPGLVIRMRDKFRRLLRFVFEGVEGDDEGSELDAWMDMAGYALIAVMVKRGLWPGCPPDTITWDMVVSIMAQYYEEKESQQNGTENCFEREFGEIYQRFAGCLDAGADGFEPEAGHRAVGNLSACRCCGGDDTCCQAVSE